MDKIYEILESIQEDADFRNSKDFLADGLLDSMDIMTIVEELEEQFGIEIGGRDIIPENFCNVNVIQSLIQRCGGNL